MFLCWGAHAPGESIRKIESRGKGRVLVVTNRIGHYGGLTGGGYVASFLPSE